MCNVLCFYMWSESIFQLVLYVSTQSRVSASVCNWVVHVCLLWPELNCSNSPLKSWTLNFELYLPPTRDVTSPTSALLTWNSLPVLASKLVCSTPEAPLPVIQTTETARIKRWALTAAVCSRRRTFWCSLGRFYLLQHSLCPLSAKVKVRVRYLMISSWAW